MPTQLLFSYGTLQDKSVQLAAFGRELAGRPDTLPGYKRGALGQYENAIPSANPADAISGTLFELTEPELTAADRYEEDAGYRRIQVTLQSGARAWLYLHP